MREPFPLFAVLGLNVYPYGLTLACAAVAAVLLGCFFCGRTRLPKTAPLRFFALAAPLGLLFARLLFVAVRADYVTGELALPVLFGVERGGFALCGALAGGALAAWLTARSMKIGVRSLLAALTPSAALMIAAGRFAECATPEGVGMYVENEALCFFPLAVQNMYEEWVMPVFAWEGAFALALCVLFACALLRGGASGDRDDLFFRFLLLFCAGQVLLESLRRDDCLKVGFVRVSQVFCMFTVVGLTAYYALRARRVISRARFVCALAVAGVGLGLGIAYEFALDKSDISNVAIYAAFVVTMAGMVGNAAGVERKGTGMRAGARG